MNATIQTRTFSFFAKCFHFAGVLLLCLCISAVTLKGQGIQVAPLLLRTFLLPGESRVETVTITNSTDEDLLFAVAKTDWDARDNGSVEVLDLGMIASSLCDWFAFEYEEFEVKAGTSEELELSIRRPEDAPNAAYWGGFFVEPLEVLSEGREEQGVGFRMKVVFVVLILQSDPKITERSGRLTAMEVEVGDSQADGQRTATISTALANTCQNMLQTNVRFEIRGATGDVVATHELEDRVVLPNHERVFIATFVADDWPPGQYIALAIIDYGGETLIGGQWPFEIPEKE